MINEGYSYHDYGYEDKVKVGDHISANSVGIGNYPDPKDAYYVVKKIDNNFIYCTIDAPWSKDNKIHKINKSAITSIVRDGKLLNESSASDSSFYQYKNKYVIINDNRNGKWFIKDNAGKRIGNDFDTSKDAEEFIDNMNESIDDKTLYYVNHALDMFRGQITVSSNYEQDVRNILLKKNISYMIDDSRPGKLVFKLKYPRNK